MFGTLLVAALAGILHLLGAERAEVVGTLLFALVFGMTLLGGRTVGLLTAGIATGAYAWLRRDAAEEAGALQLGIVVIGRAISYFVLAYVTDIIGDRLPRLPVITLSVPGRSGPPPADDASYEAPVGQAALVSHDAYGPNQAYEEGAYQAYEPHPEPAWAPPAASAELGYGAFGNPGGEVGGNGVGTAMPAMDHYPPDEYSPPVDSAPQMPVGWTHPEDYGDEIPVGHTGELFLQDVEARPDDGTMLQEEHAFQESQPYYSPDDYRGYDSQPGYQDQGYQDQAYQDQGYDDGGYEQYPGDQGYQAEPPWDAPAEPEPAEPVPHIDPETKLWTAGYFRDRLMDEREQSRLTGAGFSVVMIQIPDTPFQSLSYRREVALLRELGHQFIRAQVVDHLVHLPDEGHHWFAVVLSDTDKTTALGIERRLRTAIAGYLRNRGLGLGDVQSAALTSPDDDEMMSTIWSSLLGESLEDQATW